jgi:hypothetical protein
MGVRKNQVRKKVKEEIEAVPRNEHLQHKARDSSLQRFGPYESLSKRSTGNTWQQAL